MARRTVMGGAAMGMRAWTVNERVDSSGKRGVGMGARKRPDVLPSGRSGSLGRAKPALKDMVATYLGLEGRRCLVKEP